MRGRILPQILQRSMVLCLHNLVPKGSAQLQDCAPPWGFCTGQRAVWVPHTCHTNTRVHQSSRYKPEEMGPQHLEICIAVCKVFCAHAEHLRLHIQASVFKVESVAEATQKYTNR